MSTVVKTVEVLVTIDDRLDSSDDTITKQIVDAIKRSDDCNFDLIQVKVVAKVKHG